MVGINSNSFVDQVGLNVHSDFSADPEISQAQQTYLAALQAYRDNPSEENAEALAAASLEFAQEVQGSSELSATAKEDILDGIQDEMVDATQKGGKDGGLHAGAAILQQTAETLDDPAMRENFEKMEAIEDAAEEFQAGAISFSEFMAVYEANKPDTQIGDQVVDDPFWPWGARQERTEQAEGFINAFFEGFDTNVTNYMNQIEALGGEVPEGFQFVTDFSQNFVAEQQFNIMTPANFLNADGTPNTDLINAQQAYLDALAEYNEVAGGTAFGFGVIGGNREEAELAAKRLAAAALEFAQELQGSDSLSDFAKEDMIDQLQAGLNDAATVEFGKDQSANLAGGAMLKEVSSSLDNPVLLENFEAVEKLEDAAVQVSTGEMSIEEFKALYAELVGEGFDNDIGQQANDREPFPWLIGRSDSHEQATALVSDFFNFFDANVNNFIDNPPEVVVPEEGVDVAAADDAAEDIADADDAADEVAEDIADADDAADEVADDIADDDDAADDAAEEEEV